MADGREMKTTDDKPSSKIDDGFPKEALVLIPLIGSVLAITYDVGYFYGIDINFFTFFSVTEHLVFAMEAAPMAFIFAVFITFIVGTERGKQYVGLEAGKPNKQPQLFWVSYVIGAAFIAFGLFYGYVGVLSAVITGILTGYVYTRSPPRNVIFVSAGATILFVAWTTGFDSGRAYLRNGNASHSLQTTNQVLSVNIIRSGDKGVLFYEPKEKQIAFLKWDQIQKISETRQ